MRSWHDPIDPFDLFERQAAEAEAARLAEAKEKSRLVLEAVARERAEAVARCAKWTAEANRRALLGEYQRAQVKPPFVDADGRPTVSLTLLRWMGWTIEPIGDRNVLVAPAATAETQRRRREDYGHADGS